MQAALQTAFRAGLQDGEPPYLRRRMTFMEEVISEDDDDMDKENEEPDDAEHDADREQLRDNSLRAELLSNGGFSQE